MGTEMFILIHNMQAFGRDYLDSTQAVPTPTRATKEETTEERSKVYPGEARRIEGKSLQDHIDGPEPRCLLRMNLNNPDIMMSLEVKRGILTRSPLIPTKRSQLQLVKHSQFISCFRFWRHPC